VMGYGGMPRKKKDDIDWDNLEGKSLAECHSACLQYADVVLSRSHCRSLALSLVLTFSLSRSAPPSSPFSSSSRAGRIACARHDICV